MNSFLVKRKVLVVIAGLVGISVFPIVFTSGFGFSSNAKLPEMAIRLDRSVGSIDRLEVNGVLVQDLVEVHPNQPMHLKFRLRLKPGFWRGLPKGPLSPRSDSEKKLLSAKVRIEVVCGAEKNGKETVSVQVCKLRRLNSYEATWEGKLLSPTRTGQYYGQIILCDANDPYGNDKSRVFLLSNMLIAVK